MNEEDPLAQLREIALPDPIGLWPPAPGWWLLFFLVIGLITWAIIIFNRRRLKTAYRRQAIIETAIIWKNFQESNNTRHYLEETAKLVRRCAITAYPGKNIKHLTGASWLEFLDITYNEVKDKAFTLGLSKDFVSLAFQNDASLKKVDSEYFQSLQNLINDWCARHITQKHLDAIISATTELNPTNKTGANDAAV